jgi:hypothetical protein
MIKFKTYLNESKKSSKEEAGYQDKPKDGNKCVNCTMWREPNKCTAVAGIISPNGWCEWYAGGAYGNKGKLAESIDGKTLDHLKKLFPLVGDKSRASAEEAINTLNKALEDKLIYNARFVEASSSLLNFVHKAYILIERTILDYRQSNHDASDKIPYSIYTAGDIKKAIKDTAKITDLPSQLKTFFDAVKDIPEVLTTIKGYVQKGKPPKEPKPGQFVKPLASFDSTKSALSFMREATDSFAKELKDSVTTQIMNAYENMRGITRGPELPTDETSKAVASMIFVVRTKEGKKYLELLPDANTRIKKLIDNNVTEIVDGFVSKNTSKLSLILQKKGQPKSHEIVKTNVRNGMVENTMKFVFEDTSSFTLESSVIYKYSAKGKLFFQYPTRFKNVKLADGSMMKMPSEEKMIKEF